DPHLPAAERPVELAGVDHFLETGGEILELGQELLCLRRLLCQILRRRSARGELRLEVDALLLGLRLDRLLRREILAAARELAPEVGAGGAVELERVAERLVLCAEALGLAARGVEVAPQEPGQPAERRGEDAPNHGDGDSAPAAAALDDERFVVAHIVPPVQWCVDRTTPTVVPARASIRGWRAARRTTPASERCSRADIA